MVSAVVTIATIESCDHWESVADRLQKSAAERGHEIFMVLMFLKEDSQGNPVDDRNQQAFNQLKWIQSTLNEDTSGYFVSRFAFTYISVAGTGHELAERLGVLEEDAPCIHLYSFSKHGIVLKEDRFGLNSGWLRHYLEGLMNNMSQESEEIYVREPEDSVAGALGAMGIDSDSEEGVEEDASQFTMSSTESRHTIETASVPHRHAIETASAPHRHAIETVSAPHRPTVVSRSTSNSESSTKPIVLVMGHLRLRKLVKFAIEELIKNGAVVIINFPRDTDAAENVKHKCLSSTLWADVSVWNEPFETEMDTTRIIQKVLHSKGRLDSVHIYQSLYCKGPHKADDEITEFILDGIVSRAEERSNARSPSNAVSARLDEIYQSINKQRGTLDCLPMIYSFLKYVVERKACHTFETRLKVIARPLHQKESKFGTRVPDNLAHLSALRQGLRTLDISSIDRATELFQKSKGKLARLIGSFSTN